MAEQDKTKNDISRLKEAVKSSNGQHIKTMDLLVEKVIDLAQRLEIVENRTMQKTVRVEN